MQHACGYMNALVDANGSSRPGWDLFPIPDIMVFPGARRFEEIQNAGMAEGHARACSQVNLPTRRHLCLHRIECAVIKTVAAR